MELAKSNPHGNGVFGCHARREFHRGFRVSARRKRTLFLVTFLFLAGWVGLSSELDGASATQDSQPSQESQPVSSAVGSLYIQEYRIEGAHQLSRIEVEEAVCPYLGPGRTTDDVEKARAALEKRVTRPRDIKLWRYKFRRSRYEEEL